MGVQEGIAEGKTLDQPCPNAPSPPAMSQPIPLLLPRLSKYTRTVFWESSNVAGETTPLTSVQLSSRSTTSIPSLATAETSNSSTKVMTR